MQVYQQTLHPIHYSLMSHANFLRKGVGDERALEVLHHYVLLQTFVEHWGKFNPDLPHSTPNEVAHHQAVDEGGAPMLSASQSGLPIIKSPDMAAVQRSYRSKKSVAPPPATPLQQKPISVRVSEFGNEGSSETSGSGGNDPQEPGSDMTESDDEQLLLKGKQMMASPTPATLHQDRAFHRAIRDDDDNDSDYEFLRVKPINTNVVEPTTDKHAAKKHKQGELTSSSSSNREHPASYPPSFDAILPEGDAYHALAHVITKSLEPNVCPLFLISFCFHSSFL